MDVVGLRHPVFSLAAVEITLALHSLAAVGYVDGSRRSLLLLHLSLLLEPLTVLLEGLDQLDVLGGAFRRMVLQIHMMLLLLLLSKTLRVG